ncbi:MAG: hypothetical protein KAH32_03305 [Chlamydiia bacterium]|nr:hypothetical protein [Chlamydiia bacterium]
MATSLPQLNCIYICLFFICNPNKVPEIILVLTELPNALPYFLPSVVPVNTVDLLIQDVSPQRASK